MDEDMSNDEIAAAILAKITDPQYSPTYPATRHPQLGAIVRAEDGTVEVVRYIEDSDGNPTGTRADRIEHDPTTGGWSRVEDETP